MIKDGTILYKKVKMKNGKFLYSFRDPKMAYKQVFKYLSKYKKVKIKEDGNWMDVTMLKYITSNTH